MSLDVAGMVLCGTPRESPERPAGLGRLRSLVEHGRASRAFRVLRPRLTIYVCQESQQVREQQQQKQENGEATGSTFYVYHAIYLEDLTAVELTEKIAQLFNISPQQISQIFKLGPTGIHVLVSDEMIQNFQDETCFILDTMKAETNDGYHIILK